MSAQRQLISNHDELIALFVASASAYENIECDYTKSRYGAYQDLQDMSEYELDYSPYTEIAQECARKSISLKRSNKTGRLYAWNANVGGHAPKLELRPVMLSHVEDKELMKRYHENWAYELGCNIDLHATYEI